MSWQRKSHTRVEAHGFFDAGAQIR
jgi:hypothetical protein